MFFCFRWMERRPRPALVAGRPGSRGQNGVRTPVYLKHEQAGMYWKSAMVLALAWRPALQVSPKETAEPIVPRLLNPPARPGAVRMPPLAAAAIRSHTAAHTDRTSAW